MIHKERPTFRTAPRVDIEVELSLLVGRLDVLNAARYVLMSGSRTEITTAELEASRVRYVEAGRLREVELAVVHTRSRIASVEHASIVWPSDAPLEQQKVPWPPPVSASFEGCFNEW
jgi:hypothetical protein